MTNYNYLEFLRIAEQLNRLGITPLLMGSLGLELRTNHDWQAKDIDIHIPGDPVGHDIPEDKVLAQWSEIQSIMHNLGYHLADLHEHEFHFQQFKVQYASMNTLPSFTGIPLTDLEQISIDYVHYYLPTNEQFLAIYQASSKDSYRQIKGNQKDFPKIEYLSK